MLCVRAAADFSACDLGFGAWHCIPNDILTDRAGVSSRWYETLKKRGSSRMG